MVVKEISLTQFESKAVGVETTIVVLIQRAVLSKVQLLLVQENVGGCDFHWKQLLHRNLEEYRIREDLIKALIKSIEMLTVLPYEEIPKGIA